MKKPSSCYGCPFYGNGEGFVPDTIVEGSEVMVYGQNPGEFEEKGQKVVGGRSQHYDSVPNPTGPAPYIGPTGLVMDSQYLPLAGLDRERISLGNAIRCRVGGSNDLPPVESGEVAKAMEHCFHAHHKAPDSVKLYIAEGAYALRALTGEGVKEHHKLDAWRGYLLPFNPVHRPTIHHKDVWTPGKSEVKVLSTYHLAYLFRAPWEKPASQRDWSKVQAILKGYWPMAMPELISTPPVEWPHVSAFDTEWNIYTGELTRYSMAHTNAYDSKVKVYVVEAKDVGVVKVNPGSVVILQNEMADIEDMNKIFAGVNVVTEDTMLAHAVLWPDLGHDLNFLGSLYARINRWKHLNHANPRVYSGADALGTLDVWQLGLEKELKRDPGSMKVYREYVKPLVPIIIRAKQVGSKVNHPRVKEVLDLYGKEMDDAQAMATAAVGWPLNIGSPDQVKHWLYEIEKIHINPMSGKVRR